MCSLIAAIIVVAYSPTLNADFVWDDKIIFHDTAWFRGNGNWFGMLLHGFPEWRNYFRPLGLMLFSCEARLFGVNAMPFHAVSIALHVANAFVLSRLAKVWFPSDVKPLWVPAFAMLFYGLHPTLIEPVSWIAAQCDLLATLLVFVGLLINARVNRVAWRAVLLGVCCLSGLLVKESAAALPLLVVVSDWYVRTSRGRSFLESAVSLLRSNLASYVVLFGVVVIYGVLRHLILGGTGFSMASPTLMRHVQTVAFLYMKYWQLVVSPATHLSPMHTVPTVDLDHASAITTMYCIAALLLLLAGLVGALLRNAVGILILGTTTGMLSVLHLLPVDFDESLYHERYTIIAIAFFAAFFPTVLKSLAVRTTDIAIRVAAVAVGTVWLIASVAMVRAIVPMWKNDVTFWQWAWRNEPTSVSTMDHLMAAYIDAKRLPEARGMAAQVLRQQTSCVTCLLNIAYLAIRDGDTQQAESAVEQAGVQIAQSQPSKMIAFEYIRTIGDLRQLQKEPEVAEAAYRDAISTDPFNPDGYFSLALLLAHQGRLDEAQATMQKVRELSAADDLQERIAVFEQVAGKQRLKNEDVPN